MNSLVRPAVKRCLIFNRPTIESISFRYRRCCGNIIVIVIVIVVIVVVVVVVVVIVVVIVVIIIVSSPRFFPFAARNERTFSFFCLVGGMVQIYISI